MQPRSETGGAVRSILFFFAMLALLVAAAAGAGGYFAYREAKRPGPLEEPAIVLLKPGLSVSAIAATLKEAGVVRYSELFIVVVRVKGAQGRL
ncbi:MAG: hypothetical protein AB7P23_08150, partial [Amphiplicatus sp.]